MLFTLMAGISRNLSHEGLGRAGNASPRTEVSQRDRETTPSESRWVGWEGAAEQAVAAPPPLMAWALRGSGCPAPVPPGTLGTSGPLTPSSKVGKYKLCFGCGNENREWLEQ